MKLLSQILVVLVTTGFSAHAESAPELSERTVDVDNDVSLRVIEAGEHFEAEFAITVADE